MPLSPRSGDGWDPSGNATALFAYALAANLTVAGWELGDEPDLWPQRYGLTTVSGQQLADDLRTLQASRLGAWAPGRSPLPRPAPPGRGLGS